MKISVDLPDMAEVISKAVEEALADKQSKLANWPYYTLTETSKLLQVKTNTLLDKRMPFLNEIEYSQSGKLYWFKKESVEKFIASRHMRKYKR
jgi:hypothetical protein